VAPSGAVEARGLQVFRVSFQMAGFLQRLASSRTLGTADPGVPELTVVGLTVDMPAVIGGRSDQGKEKWR
jgi:hypothetical protein